nr:putative reverse transcriptase domain, ribonuclease H-like domain, aspartic peptidase domain protein [Tanacetum cinerariifolium]
MAPKRARTTRANLDPTRTTTATEPMTQEAINNMIAQRVTEALAEYETQINSVVNGDTSHTTGTGPRAMRSTRECTYKDYLNCRPLKFNGTEGVIVSQEVAYAMPWKNLRQMMNANYTLRFQELALLCGRMFTEESDKIERYVGGLPEMIRGNVMSYEPKSMQKAIEFANDQMDQKLLGIADRQADNKRKFDNTSRNQKNQQPFRWNNNVARTYNNYPKLGDRNQGNRNQENQNQAGNGNAVARAYGVGTAGGNPNANVMTGYPIFLANITTKTIKDKSKEKRLENVPIVRDFSKVFPKDLPGLPLTRQVKFQIDLIPGAAPVARAPYRFVQNEGIIRLTAGTF